MRGPTLLVQGAPAALADLPDLEEAAISCEQIQEAWQAIEQALLHLNHLPAERAWQVLLAPFGLQVVAPPSPAESAPGGAP